ncbi:MAG: hypothetical protein FJW96_14155 [Actinobacteria bacterium]|nr:hypothetical protein [Actinomycetota bacterium]
MRVALERFWAWYERNYALNVTVAAVLFALQLVHLVWLTFDPLWARVFDHPAFEIEKPWSWPLLLVDYTEIPALLTVSLVYVNEVRKGGRLKPIAYLLFLNSQWLHIFWITDEFVVESGEGATSLPAGLAYVAILIDYLELPVIVDTFRKTAAALRERRGARRGAGEELR